MPSGSAKKRNTLVAAALATLVLVGGFWALQRLLMPKYMQKPFEGALTAEYYSDPHRNDVLVLGDCEVYENLSPITLWQDYGYSSYIRGTAKQLMWQSQAMLEDALRYERPKVVVLSVLAMMYGEPQPDSEAYNRMTLDGMRWSPVKWRAVQSSMLPQESFASYLFPLLRFHDRWRDMQREDWQYYWRSTPVAVSGFVMRADVRPAGWMPEAVQLPSYRFGAQAWQALEAIRKRCAQEGIALVLLKAPSLRPYWYPEWEQQMQSYAQKHSLPYLNALQEAASIGIDFSKDTYDGGFHLNVAGAEKLAHRLGAFLQANIATLNDQRGNPELEHIWQTKQAQYSALLAAQQNELAVGGKVLSYHIPNVQTKP